VLPRKGALPRHKVSVVAVHGGAKIAGRKLIMITARELAMHLMRAKDLNTGTRFWRRLMPRRRRATAGYSNQMAISLL
jgi:hypothetical protein